MSLCQCYAGFDATSELKPYEFKRREVGENDVKIDILFCGICHSDIHTVRNEWGGAVYPLVPGHEIVGKVVKVGSQVTRFKVGDTVGVGCMVDSCGQCKQCKDDLEQFCEVKTIFTYNSPDAFEGTTKGGYSDHIVVKEKFVLKMPENLELAKAAPLLCAGITTYSPLKHWNVKQGDVVGVIGLGGLGHMAVKLAKSMGAHVVVFTTSPNKKDDALKMGANEVIISKNADEMQKQEKRINFIIDTVSAPHNLASYMNLLAVDGTLCMVGVSPDAHAISSGNVIYGRRSLSGSLIGGIAETQEMLDYCSKHNIMCDIEMIPIQKLNEAYARMMKSDVKYRFVIDMQSLKNA